MSRFPLTPWGESQSGFGEASDIIPRQSVVFISANELQAVARSPCVIRSSVRAKAVLQPCGSQARGLAILLARPWRSCTRTAVNRRKSTLIDFCTASPHRWRLLSSGLRRMPTFPSLTKCRDGTTPRRPYGFKQGRENRFNRPVCPRSNVRYAS